MIRGRPWGARKALKKEQQGADADERSSGKGGGSEAFSQDQDAQENGERNAQFVKRRDAGDIPLLKRAEIEKPGKSGGQGGEKEEKEIAPGQEPELPCRAGEDGDAPDKDKNEADADGGGQIGVDVLDAHLGKKGGKGRAKGREKGVVFPHIRNMPSGRPARQEARKRGRGNFLPGRV